MPLARRRPVLVSASTTGHRHAVTVAIAVTVTARWRALHNILAAQAYPRMGKRDEGRYT